MKSKRPECSGPNASHCDSRRLRREWLSALAVLAGCYGVDPTERALLRGDFDAGSGAGLAAATSSGAGSGVVDASVPGPTAPSPSDAGGGSARPAPGVASALADASSPDASASGASGPDASVATGDAAAPTDAGQSSDAGRYLYPILPSTCSEPYTDGARHHDVGYNDSAKHGPEALVAGGSCKSCHGDTLQGCAKSPACDSCHSGGHEAGWRTDCVYCHGRDDNGTGAPPRFLDEADAMRGATTFLVHSEHVTEGDHPAYDCVQCHKKPVDVLSAGHMFDLDTETPGRAEINFVAGLSKAGTYQPGTCANLYCHGNGRSTGAVKHTDSGLNCGSCHADRIRPTALGGSHAAHLTTTEGGQIQCAECHGQVVSGDNVITGKARHVDGRVDVRLPSGVTMDSAKTCTGTCHGFLHGFPFQTRTW
jgi:predicted CxxxxCH...CXXCH cytochrome family protein